MSFRCEAPLPFALSLHVPPPHPSDHTFLHLTRMLQTFLSGAHLIHLNYTPATPANNNSPAILLLHGAGGNVGFWFDRIAPALSRFGIAVYAVHYFERTGTTRADPAILRDGTHVPLWIDTIRDALTHIAQPTPGTPPRRVALIGISLGAFLALALATQLPTQVHPVRCIVSISGGLVPPYDAQATSSFPPTLILHGDADSIVPISNAHTLDTLLTRLNVPHQLEILRGEGHWFSAGSQTRILAAVATFLGKHL